MYHGMVTGYESRSDAQKITYIIIPSKIAVTHNTMVGFMSFLLAKHVCRSVLKCQDATSQMPMATAVNPNATWMKETMTVVSITLVPGEVKTVPKEGSITARIVIM